MRPQLAIFDFDGTLVDSEPNYDKSWDALLKEKNIYLTPEQRAGFVGLGTQTFASTLIKDFNLTETVDELVTLSDNLYLNIARKSTPVFAPMKELLRQFQHAGIRCAVASGSSLSVIEELLDICQLRSYFCGVYSAEQVKHGKPDPEIFLYAAQAQHASPEHCIVLEDSKPGIIAAHQAGMRVIAVPVEEQFAHPIFQSAWLTFPGANHLSVKAVLAALHLAP